jgi:hypothetical protein
VVKLAEVGSHETIRFAVSMADTDYNVRVNNEKEVTMPGKLTCLPISCS